MEADNIDGKKEPKKTSCVGMYLAVYCGTFHIYWIVWDTG